MARLLISESLGALRSATENEGACHKKGAQEAALFEQSFSDSGFWDYAILCWYDTAARKVMTHGVTALSELGWTESAALALAGALQQGPLGFSLSSVKEAGPVFFALGQNYALLLSGGALLLAAGGWFGA